MGSDWSLIESGEKQKDTAWEKQIITLDDLKKRAVKNFPYGHKYTPEARKELDGYRKDKIKRFKNVFHEDKMMEKEPSDGAKKSK